MTLLEALKAIHDKMQNPDNWRPWGICHEIFMVASASPRDEFRRLTTSWPKYSGWEAYPIPGVDGETCINAYNKYGYASHRVEADYSWNRETSPYAALRWELLEWCITELEKAK